jgi:hypothetical protein
MKGFVFGISTEDLLRDDLGVCILSIGKLVC